MRTEEIVFENGEKTVHTFNNAGSCVRTTDYEASGSIRYDIQYDVDPSQRVVGWKVFDSNGNTLKRFEIDFDEGREIEKRQYGADDKLERLQRFVYENDRRIEEQHFDAAGKLRSSKVFTSVGGETVARYYDVEGNPIAGPAA
jgi:hypothetical protein